MRERLAAVALLAALAGPARADSEVATCLPLADGRVLAATDGGLALLDAELAPVRVWTSADGLPGTAVLAIAEDGDGLWVGTEAGPARLRWRDGELAVERSLRSAPARALLSRRGDLVVGTWGGGVLVLARGGTELVPLPFAEPGQRAERARVTALALRGDTLFAGTAGAGLYVEHAGALLPYDAALPSPMVFALAASGRALWVGTLGGLVEVGEGGAVARDRSDVRALALIDGARWIGTYGEGLQGEGAGELPARFVHAVVRRGELTCAATSDGLFLRRGAGPWRAVAAAGPPSSDISAVAVDGPRLWVGTFDAGLSVREEGRWRRVVDKAIDDRINALVVDGARLWVATPRGLAVIEGGRARRFTRSDGLPSDEIHSIAPRAGGGVWIGTGRGAASIRTDRVERVGRVPRSSLQTVWALAEGADGSLWLGTSRGLFRRGADRRWRRYSVMSGHLRDDWVTALAVDGGTVWVGTYQGGVARLALGPAGGATAEQLGGGYVNLAGLHRAGDRLYAATMDGLLVRPAAAGAAAWTRVAAPGRDVTAVAGEGAEIWVATRRGLAHI